MQQLFIPVHALWALVLVGVCACDFAPRVIELPPLPARSKDAGRPMYSCTGDETAPTCQSAVHVQCERRGEFVEAITTDCGAMGKVCDVDKTCVTCRPGKPRCRDCNRQGSDCNPNVVEDCTDDGNGYAEVKECGIDKPEVCYAGDCTNACDLAQQLSSYAGCDFFAADLDNAAIDDTSNASAQQYAVVVANPQRVPVEVTVALNAAPYGEPIDVQQVDKKLVPPGDLEVFKLPRREVDGSSAMGINDGTHSAVSSNAYRVTANYPISAYQFNPLENVNVFSNDASLLLPVPALGSRYTVVGWPQTIGNSKNPEQDFDHTSSNEDLRAFLTIIGARENTHLQVELGKLVGEVVQAPYISVSRPGEVLDLQIGPYDVINLETSGLNMDFTGTRIQADHPVAVFVGSEASDVPKFGTYATRQCCADHLEEQLLPDSSAGSRFVIGRMPARGKALNDAALPGAPLGVAELNEPEWIRMVATSDDARTHVRTTLDPPDDDFWLDPRGDANVRADRDFVIDTDQPIHVLEALGSQGVTGIPKQYPGGDPSIIAVPPVLQFRSDYIFLTPDKYSFDFVTLVAPANTRIELDGAPLPDTCESTKAGEELLAPDDSGTPWVVHRCQLSFPEVTNGTTSGGLMGGSAPTIVRVLPGEQHDGAHTIVADQPISIVVYGFDRFVSYAYVGGLNLTALN